MISILSGFVAGLVHVVSGPDHLAAVAPLSVEKHEQSWKLGLRWGMGHASGVFLVGVAAFFLKELLPVDGMSVWAERLVGIVLIGIGLWGLKKGLRQHVHAHEHEHENGGGKHWHIHVHGHSHSHSDPKAHSHQHAAFAIGTLHGLAGSSHFLGVLPALAFPSWVQACGYLGAYAFGSIAAMGFFAAAMGVVAKGCNLGGTAAYRTLLVVCSVAAMGVGGYWLVA